MVQLALVDPREVAPGVHQPHQKQPRLAADAVQIDEHLEAIDLREIARPIGQRHEHLTPLPLPLRNGRLDDRHTHAVPFATSNAWSRVAVRRCLPPVHCSDSASKASTRGPTVSHTGRGRGPLGRRAAIAWSRVPADGHPRQPQLSRDRPLRPLLHQHFVPDDMYLIHPAHPPANPGSLDPASPHQALRWSTFRAANGLLSERRAQMANSDGTNPLKMTSMGGPQCSNPQWSPDGKRIVFNSRREGTADLYILQPDTGEVRRITHDPSEELEPRWSRDGQWIYSGQTRRAGSRSGECRAREGLDRITTGRRDGHRISGRKLPLLRQR